MGPGSLVATNEFPVFIRQLKTKEGIESWCPSQKLLKICPCVIRTFPSWATFRGPRCALSVTARHKLHSHFRASRCSRSTLFTTCQHRALAKKMGFRQVLVDHPPTATSTLPRRLYSSLYTFGFMQPSEREDQWDRFPGAHLWEWIL